MGLYPVYSTHPPAEQSLYNMLTQSSRYISIRGSRSAPTCPDAGHSEPDQPAERDLNALKGCHGSRNDLAMFLAE